jgi:hypothetical protein
MKDNDIPWGKNTIEIIEDVTKKYIFRLVQFPAGHIQDNRALILEIRLEAAQRKNKRHRQLLVTVGLRSG